MRVSEAQLREAAQAIVREVLYVGLEGSTWKDMHPSAYQDLLTYEQDLQQSAANVLRKFKTGA